jgi:hypothetical protein
MTELENKSTGPRTEEGKQRSSQNSLKHGLFATKSFLLPGESQEEFDKLQYRYHRDYQPKGAIEEDLVRQLADIEWRRRRIPLLEADSIVKSLESGDAERRFMHTYSIYDQRFNRILLSTLKTLEDIQTKRRRATAVEFRIAVLLYRHSQDKHIDWNPADDGFVFSTGLLHRRLDLADRLKDSCKGCGHFATEDEVDVFIAKPVM